MNNCGLGKPGMRAKRNTSPPAMSSALGWAKIWTPICEPTLSSESPVRVIRMPAEMEMSSEGIWDTSPSPMVRMP